MNPIWMSAVLASQAVVAANSWLAGGISPADAVVAYQPIGAASLAASYVNLANPGVNDAAPGVAPTWASATGWTFNGTDQYLDSGDTPESVNFTIIVRFSEGSTTVNTPLMGNGRFELWGRRYSDGASYRNGAASRLNVTPPLVSGVLAVTGAAAYRNGALDGELISDGAVMSSVSELGRISTNYGASKIQAAAIYNATLTAAQVAAVSAAMAALT